MTTAMKVVVAFLMAAVIILAVSGLIDASALDLLNFLGNSTDLSGVEVRQ